MPRLDAQRLGAWRNLYAQVTELHRAIDEDLRREWAVSLGLFEILDALQRSSGKARPTALASSLRIPVSSLTRRFDRLEEEGWVRRSRPGGRHDGRIIEVSLTQRGRALWNDMRITYRRSVQARFARHLRSDQIDCIEQMLAAIDGPSLPG